MTMSELNLDIKALTKIAGFSHWIPITQGLYKDFFKKNYPGWEWNQIIPVLIKKGVIEMNSKDPALRHLSQGLFISQDVESVSIKRVGNGSKVIVHKTQQRED